MPFKNYRTLIEIILFWVMPLTVLSFLYFAFSDIISQAQYVLFLLFPALTMYLVVGVGAGYCRFWYFNTFLNVKGVALTLGFVYSAVVNLGAWIFFGLFESLPVLWLLGIGVCCAAGGTLVDILLLGSGLFYTKSKKFPVGSDPLKHALSYGPAFFGMVGMLECTWLNYGELFAYLFVFEYKHLCFHPALIRSLCLAFCSILSEKAVQAQKTKVGQEQCGYFVSPIPGLPKLYKQTGSIHIGFAVIRRKK